MLIKLVYLEAIKSIQFWVLNTVLCKWLRQNFFHCHFIKCRALQNKNANCFTVIVGGVMVLNLKSDVPCKTRFVDGKRQSELH